MAQDLRTNLLDEESIEVLVFQFCSPSSVICTPARFVRVERCRHSTLVLGAVETVVRLYRCEDLTVITACRRLQMR